MALTRDPDHLCAPDGRTAFFEQPEIRALKKIPEFEHFRQDHRRRTSMIRWNAKQLAAAGIDKRRLR
jgi:hypothetical protein